MKVFQCIHKYRPHIPQFEKKYGVTDDMNFETLRRLVIQDGYASAYILQPALEGESEEVFYTLWDYERLQFLWAKEHGLKSTNLDEIKLAQIEEFKPDVFYNLSAVYDNGFINKLGKNKSGFKRVYWNGIIAKKPMTILAYDGHISLHRPFVEYWKSAGLAACELQPGIPEAWRNIGSANRDSDVMFYGQYAKKYFGTRAGIIDRLIKYKLDTNADVRCHLQYATSGIPLLFRKNIPWTNIRLPIIITFPSKLVRELASPPLYGDDLYQALGQTKIVVNGFTDFNADFKSNMRLFEAIGLGAFLISEEGIYPDGFESGVDFYTYSDPDNLIDQIERVLNDWPAHAGVASRTRQKISGLYNKQRQWNDFQEFIASL
jgi:Glycosyl transferases group 1